MLKRRTGKAMAAVTLALGLQFAAAVPASATRVFGPTDISFGGSMTLYGSEPARDNTTLHDLTGPDIALPALDDQSSVTAVPEPANWLLMLVGFGLLGIAARSSSPTQILAHQIF